jgi:hypothetical protein
LRTETNPATEIKSIGLPAFAQLSWFLQSHLDSYIMTGQILPIYRDTGVKTVPSGRENPRPSIGTLQKHMPTLTETATSHTTGPLYVRVVDTYNEMSFYTPTYNSLKSNKFMLLSSNFGTVFEPD